jgi:protein-disulfide isomerase
MSQLTMPVGERDHAQGRAGAPVTLVEYGDYECPSCGMAHPIVKKVRARFGDRLRFVFRNFPLADLHPHAQHAAAAAEAAGAQGKLWEMHDRLFEHQRHLEDDDLLQHARELGLKRARFILDVESVAVAERVREDFLSGVRSGVNGTPTFFVNGVRHDGGWGADELVAAVERALGEPRPAAAV